MLTPDEQHVLDHYVKLRRHGLRHRAACALAAIGTGLPRPQGTALVDRVLDVSQAWLEQEKLWFATGD